MECQCAADCWTVDGWVQIVPNCHCQLGTVRLSDSRHIRAQTVRQSTQICPSVRRPTGNPGADGPTVDHCPTVDGGRQSGR